MATNTFSLQKVQEIQSLNLVDGLRDKVLKDAFKGAQITEQNNIVLFLEKIQYQLPGSGPKLLFVPRVTGNLNTIPGAALAGFRITSVPFTPFFNLVTNKKDNGYELLSTDWDPTIISSNEYNYVVRNVTPFLNKFDKGQIVLSIEEFLKTSTSISVQTFVEHCEMVYCLLLKNCTSIYSILSHGQTSAFLSS
jgi:hypothetical protein